jgi:hypothetical protein
MGEMQFIQPNTGEVLALADISDVMRVSIGKRQFVPVGGGSEFMELLTTKGDVSLGLKRKAKG